MSAKEVNEYLYDCGWNAGVEAAARLVCLETERRIYTGAETTPAMLLRLTDEIRAMTRGGRILKQRNGE